MNSKELFRVWFSDDERSLYVMAESAVQAETKAMETRWPGQRLSGPDTSGAWHVRVCRSDETGIDVEDISFRMSTRKVEAPKFGGPPPAPPT